MSGEPPSDDLHPLDDSSDGGDAPSEEERQAANALREALEGRPGGTHLPEPALETAALLRFSSETGRLSQQRRAVLRAELLGAPSAARKRERREGWRHWLGIGLGLASGVAAVVVIGVIGARQLSEPAASQEASLADEQTATAAPTLPIEAKSGAATPLRTTTELAERVASAAAPAPPAEPEPLARRAANGERESEPAARLAPASNAAASGESTGGAARAVNGGGAADARVLAQGPAQAPRAEARRSEARDDQDGDQRFALGGSALQAPERVDGTGADRSRAPAAPAATVDKAEAKKTQTVPTEQVRRASDRYRARLLADLANPSIDGVYAEADRARSNAALEGAEVRLRALASSGLGTSADAERLRPDIYCRLAEIALQLGQPQAALDWARRGLALGAPASPFVARLYLLEGRAKSALGDRDGAARSYLHAIQVNEQLLDESLDSP